MTVIAHEVLAAGRVVGKVLPLIHGFPAQLHLLDRHPQHIAMHGPDVVDVAQIVVIGIDVLGIARYSAFLAECRMQHCQNIKT